MIGVVLTAVCTAVLLPTEAPPVLNSPVYSLATLNADGSTNMQILTYATPVGIGPRKWAVSLYRPTLTYANWMERRTGVLQLLAWRHFDRRGAKLRAVQAAAAAPPEADEPVDLLERTVGE